MTPHDLIFFFTLSVVPPQPSCRLCPLPFLGPSKPFPCYVHLMYPSSSLGLSHMNIKHSFNFIYPITWFFFNIFLYFNLEINQGYRPSSTFSYGYHPSLEFPLIHTFWHINISMPSDFPTVYLILYTSKLILGAYYTHYILSHCNLIFSYLLSFLHTWLIYSSFRH
jgi:hypothetical protein